MNTLDVKKAVDLRINGFLELVFKDKLIEKAAGDMAGTMITQYGLCPFCNHKVSDLQYEINSKEYTAYCAHCDRYLDTASALDVDEILNSPNFKLFGCALLGRVAEWQAQVITLIALPIEGGIS